MNKRRVRAAALACLGCLGMAQADEPRDVAPLNLASTFELPAPPPHGELGTVLFMTAEMGPDGKVVTGAPYSATAITEISQTLADGNRIRRKTAAVHYRDGKGRTRVEPQAAGGAPSVPVLLRDPVAERLYFIHPRERRVDVLPLRPDLLRAEVPAPGKPFTRPLPADGPAAPPAGPDVMLLRPADEALLAQLPMPEGRVRSEDLGERSIEGVTAKGTRSVMVIPAGEIGNEKPIEVVTESWFSEDLGLLLESRHSDPRFGETTFRLTALRRKEPDAALFVPPRGYQVSQP